MSAISFWMTPKPVSVSTRSRLSSVGWCAICWPRFGFGVQPGIGTLCTTRLRGGARSGLIFGFLPAMGRFSPYTVIYRGRNGPCIVLHCNSQYSTVLPVGVWGCIDPTILAHPRSGVWSSHRPKTGAGGCVSPPRRTRRDRVGGVSACRVPR